MDRLLHQAFSFFPQDERKNIPLSFQVQSDYECLVIRLRYGPKFVRNPEIIQPKIQKCVETYFPENLRLTKEDMKEFRQLLNFVTLSLDKDGVYVGCAHRHSPEQTIFISKAGSSWGFAPVSDGKGAWRIILHIQAVVAGRVDYQLGVYGLERGESCDTLPPF